MKYPDVRKISDDGIEEIPIGKIYWVGEYSESRNGGRTYDKKMAISENKLCGGEPSHSVGSIFTTPLRNIRKIKWSGKRWRKV